LTGFVELLRGEESRFALSRSLYRAHLGRNESTAQAHCVRKESIPKLRLSQSQTKRWSGHQDYHLAYWVESDAFPPRSEVVDRPCQHESEGYRQKAHS